MHYCSNHCVSCRSLDINAPDKKKKAVMELSSSSKVIVAREANNYKLGHKRLRFVVECRDVLFCTAPRVRGPGDVTLTCRAHTHAHGQGYPVGLSASVREGQARSKGRQAHLGSLGGHDACQCAPVSTMQRLRQNIIIIQYKCFPI